MSTAARIEELRKKFEENPRRFFAPLANELRKAGDLSQAIALCREHLPKQPGHMSGYIVFGQALYETGELDEARGVFEQALALDPENLIALRHLGDIARRQEQPQVARRWYERVLEADPRNDDIAAQLASLATPTPSVAAIPTPAAPQPAFPTPAMGAQPVMATALPTPASFTPIDLAAIPTPVTAAPAIPTPVLAAPAIPTPISAAPAIPTPVSAAPAIPTPITASPAVPTPVSQAAFAPIDLDSMVAEAPAFPPPLAPTPIESFPAILPTMPTPDSAMRAVEPGTDSEMDPFHFAPAEPLSASSDYAGASAEELEAQAARAESEAALAFEEGLVAPDWPDTSDLLARRETPRSVTPLSVPVTADAAQAFGLEASDALTLPLPEPELAAEPESMPESMPEFMPEREPQGRSVDLPLIDVTAEVMVEDAVSAASVIEEQVDDDVVMIDVASAEPLVEAQGSEAFTAVDADLLTGIHEDIVVETEETLEETREETLEETLAVEAHEDIVADFGETVAVETAAVEADEDIASEVSFASLNDELPAAPSEPSPAFVTETMGELLVSQGFIDRAVTVYEELVRRRPYDPVLGARLQELQDMQQAAAAATDAAADAEVSTADLYDAEEPDALMAAVADTAEAGAVDNSVSAAFFAAETETPRAEPGAVITARERFASLAARRVARRTPAYSTPVFSPPLRSTPAAPVAAYATPVRSAAIEPSHDESLASLFGDEAPVSASPQDEAAARQLAAAFDPQPTDLGSLSDSFFAGAAGHREPTPAFGTGRQPTPSAPAPAVPSAAAPRPASGSTGEFSFDRFFPDPARQTPAASGQNTVSPDVAATSTPAASTPAAADDLAQFSAWLKGLGNS